jgi:hypothetical protein
VDTTPPQTGAVRFVDAAAMARSGDTNATQTNDTAGWNSSLAALPQARFQATSSDLTFAWAGFSDGEDFALQFSFCVGSSAGLCDTAPAQALENPIASTGRGESVPDVFVKSGLSLENGGQYFVTVWATNDAGLSAIATSDAIVIDTTTPETVLSFAGVLDGDISNAASATGLTLLLDSTDVDYVGSTTTVVFALPGWHDPQTGIVNLEYSIVRLLPQYNGGADARDTGRALTDPNDQQVPDSVSRSQAAAYNATAYASRFGNTSAFCDPTASNSTGRAERCHNSGGAGISNCTVSYP